MKDKKDIIIAVLATFCLVSTLFVLRAYGAWSYNPWWDITDDGRIDIQDLARVSASFGTYGAAINKTALLFELQNEIVELEQRISILENLHGYQGPLEPDWFNGLVGYWKLDEGTGNLTVDSSGNNNNGTLINNPIWIDGKYGKALNLTGTNYVEIADSESLWVQNFTLEAWIYMTQRPYQQNNFTAIIHRFGTDAECSGSGYKLGFEYPTSTNDNLLLSIGIPMAGDRDLLQYNSTNDLTLNQWHHIVATSNGYTATLYIDGIPRISKTYSEAYGLVYWKSFPLLLGARMSRGLIDNAMVYNRSLSANEVLAHYIYPPP